MEVTRSLQWTNKCNYCKSKEDIIYMDIFARDFATIASVEDIFARDSRVGGDVNF